MSEPPVLSDAVRSALGASRPVVALETSVLAQGLPPPRNREAADAMERAIRGRDVEPAWTWMDGGSVRVGAQPGELERVMEPGAAAKIARRDVAPAMATGGLGATTVSATVWAAKRAGIGVVATGGTGGVHPGGHDASADLLELSRAPVTLVSSGPKSILDPVATAERFEELGIALIGYRCDRLPFFLARESMVPLEHRVDSPQEVAAVARARDEAGIEAAILVLNPVPERDALEPGEIADAVGRCRARADAEGVSGKELTPYLLRCLAERTDGASLDANLALLESNAELAAEIAAAL